MKNLGSIRRSGIEIEGDGEIFCIENDDKKKVLIMDTKKKTFKIKDINSKCILLKSSIGNNTIEIEAPSVITESYKFILPSDSGNDNEFLKTDGNGNLSWDTAGNAPGGNIGEIQIKNNNDLIGYNNLKYDSTKLTINNLTFTGNIVSSTPVNTDIILSPNGNGVVDIVSQIKYQNGSYDTGKVMSSNAFGVVEWIVPSGSEFNIGNLITKLTIPTLSTTDDNTIYPIKIDGDGTNNGIYTVNLPAPTNSGLTYKFLITETDNTNMSMEKKIQFTSTGANIFGFVKDNYIENKTNVIMDRLYTNIGQYIEFKAIENKWNIDGNTVNLTSS